MIEPVVAIMGWLIVTIICDLLRRDKSFLRRTWNGMTGRKEPEKVDRSEAIAELQQWHLNWSHPEIGDFYFWSDLDQKYKESGTWNGVVNNNNNKTHDIADNVYREAQPRGTCRECGENAHVRDRSTGFLSYCYPCFNKAKVHPKNYTTWQIQASTHDALKERAKMEKRRKLFEAAEPYARRRFQQSYGLTPDGMWGPRTQKYAMQLSQHIFETSMKKR